MLAINDLICKLFHGILYGLQNHLFHNNNKNENKNSSMLIKINPLNFFIIIFNLCSRHNNEKKKNSFQISAEI